MRGSVHPFQSCYVKRKNTHSKRRAHRHADADLKWQENHPTANNDAAYLAPDVKEIVSAMKGTPIGEWLKQPIYCQYRKREEAPRGESVLQRAKRRQATAINDDTNWSVLGKRTHKRLHSRI